MMLLHPLLLASLAAGAVLKHSNSVKETTCKGETYQYQELAGYGLIKSNARDKFGDTIGGIGSAISIPRASCKRGKHGAYTGTLFATPDRGWNTQGTINYQNRIHEFRVTLTPNRSATVANPSGPNIDLKYLNTILLTDPLGKPTTGLDADATGYATYKGSPDLPVATYTGDGFGGKGKGGKRVAIDSEGLVVDQEGNFWISDEYGPYIYRFDSTGRMIQAIQPPPAFVPMRNGSESFSSDNPPIYQIEDDDVNPTEVDSGRVNNHGLESLTASPDGKTLYALLQAGLHQDGGEHKSIERYVRLLQYDIGSNPAAYTAEYVVQLPTYPSGPKPDTAAQSELHYISPTQFLVLARDSDAGAGQDDTESLYRHADVIDISTATNIKGNTYDCADCSIAPAGVLKTGITPATYCPWLDYNINAQLNRFGVHNDGPQDSSLLNEKWESLALVPVNGNGGDGEYFLFSMSDNDFITQDGYYDFGKDSYEDESGYNLNNQILAFRVSLPKGARPG